MSRPKLISYLFYAALVGGITGLIVHILSIAGIDVAEYVPVVWLLHVAIIIIWLPMILLLRENQTKRDKLPTVCHQIKSHSFFQGVFRHTPPSLRVIIFIFALYAFINFLFLSTPGKPAYENDEYILKLRRGKEIRPITKSQYHYYRAQELRRFSGHWILFYGVAIVLLFP